MALGLEFGVDQAKVRAPRQMEGRGSWHSLLQVQGPEEEALWSRRVGRGDEQVTKLERKPGGFLGSGRWEVPTVGFTVAVGIQIYFKEERQHFFLNYALGEKRGRKRI